MNAARERGLAAAVALQAKVDPRQWRDRVDRIEDPEERQVADDYLRGILERTRVVQQLRRSKS